MDGMGWRSGWWGGSSILVSTGAVMPKPPRIPVTLPETPGFGSFGDLLGVRVPSAPPAPVPLPAPEVPAPVPRLVVRVQRKGRRGRGVTCVEGRSAGNVEDTARELRKALGCGVTVEDGVLVVQGDQRERLMPHLQTRAKKVVMG